MIGKYSKFLFFFLISQLLILNSFASIKVTSQVDKTTVPLNESITYTLTISGASKNGSFDKRIFKDFSISNQGESQRYSLINGAFESSIITTFVLRPKQVGTFDIPAAKVQIDNKEYVSRPFSIQVTDAKAPSATQSNQSPRPNQSSQFRRPGQQTSSDVMLLAEINKNSAYVGEEIIYTLYMLRQVSIRANISYSLPEFESMVTEELQRKENTFRKVINGTRYYIQEIDKRSLFAYESGNLRIPPAEASMQVSVFYDPYTLQSNALNIDIVPLPQNNIPASFEGLVGDFSLEFTPPEATAIQNKPLALKFVVKGNGNLKQLTTLQFDETEHFKIYQSSTEDFIEAKDNISGEKHFEFIVVPKESGIHNLPRFYVSYFSPAEKTYKTLSSDSLAMDVISGTNDSSLQVSQNNNIELLNADLSYLKPIEATSFTFKKTISITSIILLLINGLLLCINLANYLLTLASFKQLLDTFFA